MLLLCLGSCKVLDPLKAEAGDLSVIHTPFTSLWPLMYTRLIPVWSQWPAGAPGAPLRTPHWWLPVGDATLQFFSFIPSLRCSFRLGANLHHNKITICIVILQFVLYSPHRCPGLLCFLYCDIYPHCQGCSVHKSSIPRGLEQCLSWTRCLEHIYWVNDQVTS